MPTETFTLLERIILSSSTSSVNFTSISQGYRDLVLFANFQLTASAGTRLRVNNNSSAIYYQQLHSGDGSSVYAERQAYGGTNFYPCTVQITEIANYQVDFQDYSQTNKHKSMIIRAGVGTSSAEISACSWASTSAINEINIYQDSQQFASGSIFSLFGVSG